MPNDGEKMMKRMPCSITDGPDYDTWVDQQNKTEPDEDEAYRRMIQDEIDQHRQDYLEERRKAAVETDQVHAMADTPKLHTKIGAYTGATLYSYDGTLWFSTQETALRMFHRYHTDEQGDDNV